MRARTSLTPSRRLSRLTEDNQSHGDLTTHDGTRIFYKDRGPRDARPVMFHHGWPLSADDWNSQMLFFLSKGYRVVAHDRRGHASSPQISISSTRICWRSSRTGILERRDDRTGSSSSGAAISAAASMSAARCLWRSGAWSAPSCGKSDLRSAVPPTSRCVAARWAEPLGERVPQKLRKTETHV